MATIYLNSVRNHVVDHWSETGFCILKTGLFVAWRILPELRASCKEGDIELVNMSQQRLLEISETSLEVSDARKAL